MRVVTSVISVTAMIPDDSAVGNSRDGSNIRDNDTTDHLCWMAPTHFSVRCVRVCVHACTHARTHALTHSARMHGTVLHFISLHFTA